MSSFLPSYFDHRVKFSVPGEEMCRSRSKRQEEAFRTFPDIQTAIQGLSILQQTHLKKYQSRREKALFSRPPRPQRAHGQPAPGYLNL